MSNTSRVLDALSDGPACDDCVSEQAQVFPRQQVNQIATRLAAKGIIRRVAGYPCRVCRRVKITNALGSTAALPSNVHDEVAAAHPPDHSTDSEREQVSVLDNTWHWEGNVQSRLRTFLEESGWRITFAANTAAKQAGVDLTASKANRRLLIEVKGFPTTTYAYGPNRGKLKSTQPTNQARQYFSHALLSMMRMLDKEPSAEVALCFPDYPTYRALLAATKRPFKLLRVGVYLVRKDGSVEVYTEHLSRD